MKTGAIENTCKAPLSAPATVRRVRLILMDERFITRIVIGGIEKYSEWGLSQFLLPDEPSRRSELFGRLDGLPDPIIF